MYCISVCAVFQPVPLDPTRCPPGSRSVSPAQPTASQRMRDLWCVCVRRTTSGLPWTLPQHRAPVIRLYVFIFMCVWWPFGILSFSYYTLTSCIISSRHFCIKWAISCLKANHYLTHSAFYLYVHFWRWPLYIHKDHFSPVVYLSFTLHPFIHFHLSHLIKPPSDLHPPPQPLSRHLSLFSHLPLLLITPFPRLISPNLHLSFTL